jgi:hypothetical protein
MHNLFMSYCNLLNVYIHRLQIKWGFDKKKSTANIDSLSRRFSEVNILYVIHYVHLTILLVLMTVYVISSCISFFRFPQLLRKYFHSQSYQSHTRE